MKSIVHKSWYVERDEENKEHGPYAEVTRDFSKVHIKFGNNNLTMSFTKKALPQMIEIFKAIIAEDEVK